MPNPVLEPGGERNPTHSLRVALRNFLVDRFDLREDQAYEGQTLESVRRDVQFRGANLWILMAAILICSIGLNVNSPAVVIGAMLISPLMGPILGIGVAIAIYDFDLLLTAIKNMVIAMLASIAVSALYFAISPISEAQSELLARVNPTLWDVLIATTGGFAGIIAVSRREKGNAIPGVAIATALMPPVCTAGYAIAHGEWLYFAGSLYLFFINLVFIAFATFLIVRYMRFERHTFVDDLQERRVKNWTYGIVAFVAIPSVYTAYNTVDTSLYVQRARTFIEEECQFEEAEIIRYDLNSLTDDGKRVIELVLVGKTVPEEKISERAARMPRYNLQGVDLVVRQDLDVQVPAQPVAVGESMDAGLMRMLSRNAADLARRDSTIAAMQFELKAKGSDGDITGLRDEAMMLFPNLREFQYGTVAGSGNGESTRVGMLRIEARPRLSSVDEERLRRWVAMRTRHDSVLVVR